MRKIILLIVIAVLAWKGHEKYGLGTNGTGNDQGLVSDAGAVAASTSTTDMRPDVSASFACDGRVYCSQMKSCEEAKYFLQHCPGVKMDGNNDGIPCERQWCQ
jgi:hypothetical protein